MSFLSAEFFMGQALEEAEKAFHRGEVPVGALVVSPQGDIWGRGGNTLMNTWDPTAHAEVNALRAACALVGQPRLDGASLYVTLEPCAMCGHALALARISYVYFGAFDPKGGGLVHGARVLDHALPKVTFQGGILEAPCSQILKDFFQSKRSTVKNKK